MNSNLKVDKLNIRLKNKIKVLNLIQINLLILYIIN